VIEPPGLKVMEVGLRKTLRPAGVTVADRVTAPLNPWTFVRVASDEFDNGFDGIVLLPTLSHVVNQFYLTTTLPVVSLVPKRVLVVIVLAVGLSGALLVYGRMLPSDQKIIPFHMIANYDANGYSQPASLVINDTDTWGKAWKQAYCTPPLGSNPCWATPPVNFSTRTVIALFLGAKPSPGYSINITQIDRSGSNTIVHVLWTKPVNCGEATEETWPSYIVDIPKTEDNITFATETFFIHC
jgi:hypothetical protein